MGEKKQIAKSNVLHFLINKYFIFILQFIKTIYLALVLGPFYFGIIVFNIDLFPKYQFSNFILFVIIITMLSYFNQIFINLYCSYGLLNKIAFEEKIDIEIWSRRLNTKIEAYEPRGI